MGPDRPMASWDPKGEAEGSEGPEGKLVFMGRNSSAGTSRYARGDRGLVAILKSVPRWSAEDFFPRRLIFSRAKPVWAHRAADGLALGDPNDRLGIWVFCGDA
jgi:hypothetical protein